MKRRKKIESAGHAILDCTAGIVSLQRTNKTHTELRRGRQREAQKQPGHVENTARRYRKLFR